MVNGEAVTEAGVFQTVVSATTDESAVGRKECVRCVCVKRRTMDVGLEQEIIE